MLLSAFFLLSLSYMVWVNMCHPHPESSHIPMIQLPLRRTNHSLSKHNQITPTIHSINDTHYSSLLGIHGKEAKISPRKSVCIQKSRNSWEKRDDKKRNWCSWRRSVPENPAARSEQRVEASRRACWVLLNFWWLSLSKCLVPCFKFL